MKFNRFLVFPLLFWLLFIQLGSAWLHKHDAKQTHKHFSGAAYMAVDKNASHEFCVGCFISKIKSNWLIQTAAVFALLIFSSWQIFSTKPFILFQREIIQLKGRAPPVL